MALLLLCLLQSIIPASLGGVTLPFANLVGTVTPIKPKPLSCYKPEELPSIKSLEWDGEDIMPTLFSPVAGGSVYREFSSPLVPTSSSRPLPVPKVDKLSIFDVKIPDSCKESLPPSIKRILKLSNTPIVQKYPDVSIPQTSFPFKYNDFSNRFDNLRIPKLYGSPLLQPDLCSSSTVSNEVLLRSSTLPSASNKLPLLDTFKPNVCIPNNFPLPTIKSLPIVPLDRNPFDSLVPTANFYQSVSSSPTVYLSPDSRGPSIFSSPLVSTLDPSTSRSIDSTTSQLFGSPLLFNPFSTNNVSPISTCNPLPYPLHYRSMYLPKVRTPSRLNLINNRPTPYILNGNSNAPDPPSSQNPICSTPVYPKSNLGYTSSSLISEIPLAYQMLPIIQQTSEYILPNVNPIKITERSKCFDNVHTTQPVFSDVFNTGCTTLSACESNKQTNCGKAKESLTPLVKPTATETSRTFLKDLLSTIIAEKTCCKVSPSVPTLPSVRTSALPSSSTSTSRYEDNPCYFEPTSLKFDDTPFISNHDLSNAYYSDFNIPDMFPIVDAFVDSMDLSKRVNIPEICTTSIVPDYSSYQISMPPIPPSQIPNISPDKDCLCRITPTPATPVTSYVNVSPTSSFSKSSSKMVSSINDIVSNITKNILSSYISHLKTAAKSVGNKHKKSPKSNHNNLDLKPQQIPVQVPLPPVNLSNSKLMLSSFGPPSSKGSTFIDTPRIIHLEEPFFLTSPSTDSSNSQPFVTSSSISALLPSVSLVNYSSPPICPSQLPSPILPSYPAISSPFCIESPILKVSSDKSKKKSDRVLEFMVLSELLNGDDNYEWDDLDTLLALLAIS